MSTNGFAPSLLYSSVHLRKVPLDVVAGGPWRQVIELGPAFLEEVAPGRGLSLLLYTWLLASPGAPASGS